VGSTTVTFDRNFLNMLSWKHAPSFVTPALSITVT
jgi:hypothetical protein